MGLAAEGVAQAQEDAAASPEREALGGEGWAGDVAAQGLESIAAMGRDRDAGVQGEAGAAGDEMRLGVFGPGRGLGGEETRQRAVRMLSRGGPALDRGAREPGQELPVALFVRRVLVCAVLEEALDPRVDPGQYPLDVGSGR